MDLLSLLLYASIAAGFLMAFSLGANDVAKSMAPAVGARAITVRQAVFIAETMMLLIRRCSIRLKVWLLIKASVWLI